MVVLWFHTRKSNPTFICAIYFYLRKSAQNKHLFTFMQLSIIDIAKTIPFRFCAEKSVDFSGVFHFDITEYPFTVIIENGTCEVLAGLQKQAKCTLKCDKNTYIEMETGGKNPQLALMLGQLKVSDLSLMMQFTQMFKKFSTVDFSQHKYVESSEKTTILPKNLHTGILKGIKVLDLSRLLPAPMATMFLADWGAEVIKIENPDSPDPIRSYPPLIGQQSVYYLALNRTKRSLTLNLYSEKGKAIFIELLKTADIVVESFRPNTLKKMGIDYEMMRKVNPRIIYLSVTGYGQTGEYASKAGHDLNFIGYSGLLGLTGQENGQSAMPAAQIADVAGGSYMTVIAALLALHQREKTGKGEHIDISMLDATLPLMSLVYAEYFATGKYSQKGKGLLYGGLANYQVYTCADGKELALGALEPHFFKRFCEMAGKMEFMADLLPDEAAQRRLKVKLTQLFLTQTQAEWLEMAEGKDLCLSPVYSPEEAANDAHLQERNVFVRHTHPEYGSYTSIRQPLRFAEAEVGEGWAAPVLGEDNGEIL